MTQIHCDRLTFQDLWIQGKCLCLIVVWGVRNCKYVAIQLFAKLEYPPLCKLLTGKNMTVLVSLLLNISQHWLTHLLQLDAVKWTFIKSVQVQVWVLVMSQKLTVCVCEKREGENGEGWFILWIKHALRVRTQVGPPDVWLCSQPVGSAGWLVYIRSPSGATTACMLTHTICVNIYCVLYWQERTKTCWHSHKKCSEGRKSYIMTK